MLGEFPNRLKLLREEHGLTQKELGICVVIGTSTIGNYETGERIPNYATMMAIADFFDVSLDYLLGRTNIRHMNKDDSTSSFINENPEGYNIRKKKTEEKKLLALMRKLSRDIETLISRSTLTNYSEEEVYKKVLEVINLQCHHAYKMLQTFFPEEKTSKDLIKRKK